jgi:glucose-1-phosphate cytidylyltransferase
MPVSRPPVVILCGGRGTRLRERTEAVPKALVEIGGRPILWHVIGIYAAQGFERFLLSTGYLGEMVEQFVEEESWPLEVAVECVDTGLDTPTGGRIAGLAGRLEGAPFCATYADGVADVDLGALLEGHAAHGALATMTVVRPDLQWGVAQLGEGERVAGFVEKPRSEHWINGGFFCFEPGALEYIAPDSSLEQGSLADLAAAGQLHAHRHEGFWDCMDTYKDAVVLDDLWTSGEAPWTAWEKAGTR